MPEIGGPLAQSGFYFQNSVAALILAKMISKPDPRADHVITQVTNEAWEEKVYIDDVLVLYQDGHRCFVQVKEKITINSKAWKDLWNYVQRQIEKDIHESDRILLYIGQSTEKSMSLADLKELCCRYRKKNRYDQVRLSDKHKQWFEKIREQIIPLEDTQAEKDIEIQTQKHRDHVVSMLSYVDVEYSSRGDIDERFSEGMPECNVPASTLFRILRDIAAESAIYKTPLEPLSLRSKLKLEHDIKIKGGDNFDTLPFEPDTVVIADEEEFIMGNSDYENESPKHRVALKPYRIGKYPVTKGQFAAYVKENQPFNIAQLGWKNMCLSDIELSQPVTGVTFFDALKYCEWLSEKTNNMRKYRLPNEAEWEKAARGDEGNIYPWGDIWDEEKFRENNVSPYKCCNMVGSVAEWTCSLWGKDWSKPEKAYQYPWKPDERNNPLAHSKIRRIIRGGPFIGKCEDLRCSKRAQDLVNNRGNEFGNYGFRVVQSIE